MTRDKLTKEAEKYLRVYTVGEVRFCIILGAVIGLLIGLLW